MNKKIFVTGGFGFIGSAIIQHLQESGHDIFVYDDLSFGQRQFVTIPETSITIGNILQADALKKAMSEFGPDYVIHLAAVHFIPYCNEHPFVSANINIAGTINVLKACREIRGIEKVFFASTAAVYPIFDGPISESLAPAPSDIYGLSKWTGEELCAKFHVETQIPTVICRFFNAFGPNETNPHLIPAILQQILEKKDTIKLGNTHPKRDFIHTHDMARAVSLLLDKFESGIDTFNLGRGIEYSVLDVLSAFEGALGRKLTIEPDPARMRKTDRLHLLADINKISAFSGWKPVISLEEGIKTLIR